jgi:hypothetical protein
VRQDIALPRVRHRLCDWSIKVEVHAYVDATELLGFSPWEELQSQFDLVRKSERILHSSQTTYRLKMLLKTSFRFRS